MICSTNILSGARRAGPLAYLAHLAHLLPALARPTVISNVSLINSTQPEGIFIIILCIYYIKMWISKHELFITTS